MRLLVTGAAGFIGFHVAKRLLEEGHSVYAFDNLNPYYDVRLKQDRLEKLHGWENFEFWQTEIANRAEVERIFAECRPERVIHLAAQAGVRYSLTNPYAYVESNLDGFINILEGCRHHGIEHLVYASSSSVYGANTKVPFSTKDNVDHPISLYAATKKANELMAHAYSHLYQIPTTGLRFFTVYGPWGRPDMAIFLFTKAILDGTPLPIFNYGRMERDFTYVDDVVEGVVRVADKIPTAGNSGHTKQPDLAIGRGPYRVYNIGNHSPIELLHLVKVLEANLGKKAVLNLLPMQPGDVVSTYADIADLARDTGFSPSTSIEVGIPRFVEWYKEYYS
jgi:UDP-glucuronate 4-epimerase